MRVAVGKDEPLAYGLDDALLAPRVAWQARMADRMEVFRAHRIAGLETRRRLDRPNDVDLVPFLTNLFGLSPAHARLAAWLSSGATLHEAAAACGITYSSARTYLAAVYAKTGTRHQGELVALVKTIEMAANG